MSKKRVFAYIRRNAIPPGWWHVLHEHAERAWAVDPNAEFYIVDDWGGLRVDTLSWSKDSDKLKDADMDVLWATKATCPCCGKRFREEPIGLVHRREVCPDCRYLSAEEQNEIEFAVARRWLMED